LFSTLGVFGAYIVGVRLIGIDAGAFWGNMQSAGGLSAGHRQRDHQKHRFRNRGQLDRRVRGLRSEADAEGVSSATTRTVVMSSLAILALDFVLTVVHVQRRIVTARVGKRGGIA
jgi:phospholipid/cholesterol/gamma-HCH transport system permease protein